jgi:hypothetical protein
LCFTVLILSVPCQCPATMPSLSNSQTEHASPRYSQWRGRPSPFSCANFGHIICSGFIETIQEGSSGSCSVCAQAIRRFDTSNTAQLDPEYRKYHQYHHARDWMETSSMKMLLWHILVFHIL